MSLCLKLIGQISFDIFKPAQPVQVHTGAKCFASFRVERHVSWKRCATGFEIRFVLFGGCVLNVIPISSSVYKPQAIKESTRTWIQVKLLQMCLLAALYMQQLKILEDMFVVKVL